MSAIGTVSGGRVEESAQLKSRMKSTLFERRLRTPRLCVLAIVAALPFAGSANGLGRPPDLLESFGFRDVVSQGWFISLSALLVCGTVYAVRRVRIEQLRAMERMRLSIAADLHDDIGAGLSQIGVLSEVLRSRLDREDLEQTILASRIAELSRELADSMSDIVWAINPARDWVGDLLRRMREFAGDLFTSRDIELHFEAPNTAQDLPLNPEARRQFYLIFKECAHNIARHSGSSEVTFHFEVEANRLVMRAIDNGRGFDVRETGDRPAKGHGLSSIRLRTERLGGCVTVNSAKRQGTTVTVSVPLPGWTAPATLVSISDIINPVSASNEIVSPDGVSRPAPFTRFFMID